MMEDVIREIIDLEYKAKEVMEQTYLEKAEEIKKFQEKIIALEASIMADSEIKIVKLRKAELDEVALKNQEQVERCDQKLKKMEATVEQMKEAWVEALVNKVIRK